MEAAVEEAVEEATAPLLTQVDDLKAELAEADLLLHRDGKRLAEAERDAARYRWLRERLEVRQQQAVSGSVRDALSVRIGCAFLDSDVSKRRSLSDPDAHENGCKKFDAAIDAFLAGEKHE